MGLKEMSIKFSRPSDFDEVIGHDTVKKQLKSIIKNNITSNFLFIGPSGVGKTTLAKILMKHFGVGNGLVEYNAASLSGVDKIRELTSMLKTKPLFSKKHGVIIDECHTLSKQAWDALLIDLEQLDNVVWIFCTTENVKIPNTIRTRCLEIYLGSLSNSELYRLVYAHNILEKANISKDIIKHIANISEGSARKALMLFYSVKDIKDAEEIKSVLRVNEYNEEDNLYGFIQDILLNNISLKDCLDILLFNDSKYINFELVRNIIIKIMQKNKALRMDGVRLLDILHSKYSYGIVDDSKLLIAALGEYFNE